MDLEHKAYLATRQINIDMLAAEKKNTSSIFTYLRRSNYIYMKMKIFIRKQQKDT
jgi:hypothetical protein